MGGVAFQQSVVRKANFKNANLFSASFFDADLSGADFEGADMQQCNLEMADLTNANLKSADLTNAYAAAPCTKALECRAHSCARLHSLHTSAMPVRKCVSHASGMHAWSTLFCTLGMRLDACIPLACQTMRWRATVSRKLIRSEGISMHSDVCACGRQCILSFAQRSA